ETGFSSTGDASRGQHHAFQNAWGGKRGPRDYWIGPGDQGGDRKTARTGTEHRMSVEKEIAPLVLIVSGPSGSGKSTLVQKILELPGTMPSISCTTRPRRATESSGKCYDFVSEAEFEAMVARGEFFEYADRKSTRLNSSHVKI